jgi:hypothetical protein
MYCAWELTLIVVSQEHLLYLFSFSKEQWRFEKETPVGHAWKEQNRGGKWKVTNAPLGFDQFLDIDPPETVACFLPH